MDAQISELVALEHVSWWAATQTTTDGWTALRDLPNLRSIAISDFTLDDTMFDLALATFNGMGPLRELELGSVSCLPDAQSLALARLTHLDRLEVCAAQPVVDQLAAALPDTSVVRAKTMEEVTAELEAWLVEKLQEREPR